MSEYKEIEASVKVFFTREYGRFKFMKGNRELNEAKIKKIIKVIQDEGLNILKYAPIIINQNYEIIDGQHRFMVSKQTKENVYYVKCDDIGLEGVSRVNSNSSNWRKVDFLNSYVDLRKEPYVDLYDFLQIHPMTINSAAELFHWGFNLKKGIKDIFSEGTLSNEYKDVAYKVADGLKDFSEFVDKPYNAKLIRTMIKLASSEKYDHALMLRKFKESGRGLEDYGDEKKILSQLESIINHRAKSRITIY